MTFLPAFPASREGGAYRFGGEEKGIDVLIALDLALGARDDRYDVAVLVSADTDLVPAIEVALDAGRRVETATALNHPAADSPLAPLELLI